MLGGATQPTRTGRPCDSWASPRLYTTWLTLDNYLKAASIDERAPRSLLFRFEKVVVNPYAANQFIPIYQSVLIPDGAEADLARLQHELSTRFPALPIALA
jgi:hypothetical protein